MIVAIARSLRTAYRRVVSFQARLYLKALGVEGGDELDIVSLPLCRRHPGARIVLGKSITIKNTAAENPAGVTHPSILVAAEQGAELRIGNHVGLSGVTLYCTRSIVIEDYVSIGANATVYDTDFHPLNYLARRANEKAATLSAPVRICSDVWIGANAFILKGVTVGSRSIVAAQAVVTRDVPPDVIVAGVPAKIIAHLSPNGTAAAPLL